MTPSASMQRVLDQMERELVPSTSHDEFNGPLFHYTDAGGFLGIIQNRQIWATHFAYQNDSKELHIGEDAVERVAARLRDATNDEMDKTVFGEFATYHSQSRLSKMADVYVACLSEKGNLLSQWRAYGARGSGFSIGFDQLPVPRDNPSGAQIALMLCKVEYDIERFESRVEEVLREVANGFRKYAVTYAKSEDDIRHFFAHSVVFMMRRVAMLVPRLKDAAFSEEQEWRLVAIPMRGHESTVVKFRNSNRGITPYIPLDISNGEPPRLSIARVYVGPTQDPAGGVKAATMLLKAHNYDGESLVQPSGIPFRG